MATTEQNLAELVRRVEELEDRLRERRRGRTVSRSVIAVLVAAVVALASAGPPIPRAWAASQEAGQAPHQTLEVRELIVRGADGKVRARIGATPAGKDIERLFTLMDVDGKPRMFVNAAKTVTAIVVADETGRPGLVGLSSANGGNQLTAHTGRIPENEPGVTMLGSASGGSFIANSPNAKGVAVLLGAEGGGQLSLLDEKGNAKFAKP